MSPTPASSPAPASSTSPRFTLLETEVVHGDGADAYAGPTLIGGDDQGNGATPIVEPSPAPPPPQTTPQEAAVIGKAYAAFCRAGWDALRSQHPDAFASLVPNPEMQDAVLGGGQAMVEASATALALKHNVRIPYGDELTVGLGGAVAAFGLASKFKKPPANDNGRKRAAASSAPVRDTTSRVVREDKDEGPSPIDMDDASSPIDMSPSSFAGDPDDKEVELG